MCAPLRISDLLPETVKLPGSFTLTANAWGTSSGLKSVSFYSGATLVGTVANAPYTLSWNNVAAGSYSLTAIATDNNNVSATSSAVNVTVTGTSQPPTVSLTSPLANATTTAPGSFTLTANAASTGSTIAKVDFYQGTTLIGTTTAAPFSYTWSNVPVGNYSLTAKATDNTNATATSAPVSVTVNAASVQAYYIHADQMDTPRQITDTNGNLVWQWDNVDPFGNNMANENPNGAGQFSFNLRFPGQYFDRETNTNYNVNRDYDPAIGRYIQSDPIGLAGGINTYAYVGGNPISYVDPFGLVTAVSFVEGGTKVSSTPFRAFVDVNVNGSMTRVNGNTYPNKFDPNQGIESGVYKGTFGENVHRGGPGIVLENNGRITTYGPNSRHNNESWADGIHVHCVGETSDRGSQGCLTGIAVAATPDDERKFELEGVG